MNLEGTLILGGDIMNDKNHGQCGCKQHQAIPKAGTDTTPEPHSNKDKSKKS